MKQVQQIILVSILILSPLSALAQEKKDQAVDRLWDMLGMHRSVVSAARLEAAPNADKISAGGMACLKSIISEQALETKFRSNFREIFNDSDQAIAIIEFLETPAGLKIRQGIEQVLTGQPVSSLDFDADELMTVDKFSVTTAGKLLTAAPKMLVTINEQSLSLLGDEAVRVCAAKELEGTKS